MAIAPEDGISRADKAASVAARPAPAALRYAPQTPYDPRSGQGPSYVAPTLSELSAVGSDASAASTAAMAAGDAAGAAGDVAVVQAKAAAEAAAGAGKGTFEPVGKLLRYIAGKAPGSRIAVYADGVGGEFNGAEENNSVNPSSTGFTDTGVVTLASNTFANTVGLLMGELEASQPWVEELRTLTQGFINTGSSVDEAINLALRDAKTQGKASKFVQRFDAIFKLQDRLNKGETVQVPSIADYVKSEQQLGDVFRAVGLGDLATQEIASKVLGEANKSVAEATSLIQDIFGAIDNAPAALKADLQVLAPGVDRTSIAKALLLCKQGSDALMKQVATISQVSAAKSQGIALDESTASDLAMGGATYGTSLGKFETVKQLERGQALGRMSNINFTQQEAIGSTFNSNAAANEKIRRIAEEEANRFNARSGRLASQNRDSNQF